MPKATSSASSHPSTSSPMTSNGTHPNVLKRNQACHQCRRRKLKCDAKRPCSTCVRSHAHAVSHAPAGTHLPVEPECTFDDVAEVNVVTNEPPKNRYEKLESRINELETLLLQKDQADEKDGKYLQSQSTSLDFPAQLHVTNLSEPHLGSKDDFSPHSILGGGSSQLSVNRSSNFTPVSGMPATSSDGLDLSSFRYEDILGTAPDPGPLGKFPISPPQSAFITTTTPSPPILKPVAHYGLDVFWPNWPLNVPHIELLRHLVEVFFAFHPHAGRLFHVSSFMTSISLPPNHPKFPIPPVLHAICAVASMYTAAVSSPPLPNLSEVDPDELFNQRYRAKEARLDTFAEQQARYAKETIEKYQSMGESLLQCVQAHIILSWWYWCHSKWVEVFSASGHSLRMVVPLGLNTCPPFHSISMPVRPPSILPSARTVVEDETRRNVFWLAYAMERHCGCGNGWALSLDDQDISQLLPVRGDQFDEGVLVPPTERQWACSKDLLLTHPPEQTDSFILYVKGSILISRVKSFNIRFRAKYYAGDSSVATSSSPDLANVATDPVDPRCTPAFIEMDNIVSTFRASFPGHLRNPVVDNVVDSHLYTTCLVPHVASILLHEPHADVRRSGCISALKILTASRAILDLIYIVWSTSFDITLLDLFCTFSWFMSGRILIRFLQAAMDANTQDQIDTLRAELEFVRLAITKQGDRIPLAYRYAKMLDNLMVKICGPLPPIQNSEIAAPKQQPEPEDHLDNAVESFFYDTTQGIMSETYLQGLLGTQSQTSLGQAV